ncbi:MAG: 5-formyltetrahydrofolate cyclo-ligase [Candidatus Thermoplasmatota archaeon]|nr:5-formyltetrahydrofolate cyclo-ligase [Candidatus Thermoplasmatota archaeon]
MQEAKADLRRQLLERRNSLSTLEILEKSNQIIARLMTVPSFAAARTVLAYISHGTEVNTHGLIRLLLSQTSREVLVPVVADRQRHTLLLSSLHQWQELSTGAYGILEPAEVRERPAESVEVCLVPGIGFDIRGNRIGYGGGYYDRLLRSIRGTTIGLAYDFQVLDAIPSQDHDVPVDAVVTEKRLLYRDTLR